MQNLFVPGTIKIDGKAEIGDLLVSGASNKVIAATLGISIKTVENHRAHIMHKLDLHSIAELTRYALEHGITGN